MRGSAVTLGPRLVADAEKLGPPDLLVVSDMVDLGDLLARTRSTHCAVPVALYLHENQLTYPRRPGESLDAGLAWTTWRNLTLADQIWCNSAFHRDELLAALPGLLHDVPDHDHADLLPAVARRMRVLPVGVDIPAPGVRTKPPLIISNQRWHHDKDVDAVVRALQWLADSGAEFRAAVIGDHRGGHAAEIDPLLDQLGARVVARGLQDRSAYESLLGEADIVVSAAKNEFFGVAIVEAVGAGAVPVLPDAVAYPEIIPAQFHSAVFHQRGQLRTALAATLAGLDDRRLAIEGLAGSMTRFSWSAVAPAYDEAAAALAAAPPGGGH
jgi:glycosyltransferase involved in cell wall biosynthesis